MFKIKFLKIDTYIFFLLLSAFSFFFHKLNILYEDLEEDFIISLNLIKFFYFYAFKLKALLYI
jgi:hypothetical protein